MEEKHYFFTWKAPKKGKTTGRGLNIKHYINFVDTLNPNQCT